MFLAYKYIRDKRRAAKDAQEARLNAVPLVPQTSDRDVGSTTIAPTPDSTPNPPSRSTSGAVKMRIMLMAALVVPVIFETLDYTGMRLTLPK